MLHFINKIQNPSLATHVQILIERVFLRLLLKTSVCKFLRMSNRYSNERKYLWRVASAPIIFRCFIVQPRLNFGGGNSQAVRFYLMKHFFVCFWYHLLHHLQSLSPSSMELVISRESSRIWSAEFLRCFFAVCNLPFHCQSWIGHSNLISQKLVFCVFLFLSWSLFLLP